MLLTWIAEVADEPLVLEPTDRRVEWETNTWSLGAAGEDMGLLSAAEVVAAFERTAAAIRERVLGLNYSEVATFYVWHDEQAGQLRCSTGSVPPEALPFARAYAPSNILGPIVEGFLAEHEPDGSEIAPLHVWVSPVGIGSVEPRRSLISPDGHALAAAMARVASAFGGMTAQADEAGCGRCFDEDEVELLRTPGVPLPADLVRRIARKDPFHWDDQPAIIRRVLPQLVVALVEGETETDLMARGLAAARWSQWPREQAEAVAGFLDAWWLQTLRTKSPPTSACEVFESCVTASSSVTPWLARWEVEKGPVARRHLADSLGWWQEELASDDSPFTWWWGTEAGEQAAWGEVKRWLAAQTPAT